MLECSKKAQSLVEMLLVISAVTCAAIVFFVFTPTFQASSDRIIKSAPQSDPKIEIKKSSSTLLGEYTNEFIGNFKTLNEDPQGVKCANALGKLMSSLARFKKGTASEQDMVTLIRSLGKADRVGLAMIYANELTGKECDYLPHGLQKAANKNLDILNKEIITLNLNEKTDEDQCTIATSSNALLKDTLLLFASGQISSNAITNSDDPPVTTPPSNIEGLFIDHYYIGRPTDDPSTNYMNSINLLHYLHNNNLLSGDLKNKYERLMLNTRKAVRLNLQKSKQGNNNLNQEIASDTSFDSGTDIPPPFSFCGK